MKKPDQVYTTYIKTTPERLWAALTNPEFTRQYWGGCATLSDWKSGSKWKLDDQGEDGGCCAAGEVLECTPPKRLVLTWADPDKPADSSTVRFEIEAIEDMVCLTVVHGSFAEDSVLYGKTFRGWPRVLSSLKSFIETGKGLNVWAGL